jgi:hypothetical protein
VTFSFVKYWTFCRPPTWTMAAEAALHREFFSASGKEGRFWTPRTTRVDYAKRRRFRRLSWLIARPLPEQHRPASPISMLIRK